MSALFYSEQLQQLEKLPLSEEFIEQLTADYNKLNNAQEIDGLAQGLSEIFSYGADNVVQQMGAALDLLRQLEELEPGSTDLKARIDSAFIEIEDIASEVTQYQHAYPQILIRSEDIEKNMREWMSLKRKFGALLKRSCTKNRLLPKNSTSKTTSLSVWLKYRPKIDKIEVVLTQAAEKLHALRSEWAVKLSSETEALLKELGFKKARFQIDVVRSGQFTSSGLTEVCFLICP